MSALQLLTMLQLKRKLMAHSFIIHSWVFFCITSIYFDLLDYSNKLRGHMQTNTAQCSGWVQETILFTESCQEPVFYKLHIICIRIILRNIFSLLSLFLSIKPQPMCRNQSGLYLKQFYCDSFLKNFFLKCFGDLINE